MRGLPIPRATRSRGSWSPRRFHRQERSRDVLNPLVSSILLATTLVVHEDGNPSAGVPGPLDQQLRREDPAMLARDARRLGDARRGALVF